MILLVQDRNDNHHLVDYTSYYGEKYTICGEIYSKSHIINIIALDNVIPGICQKCLDDYDWAYSKKILSDFRLIKGSSEIRALEKVHDVSRGMAGPEMKYDDLWPDRYWAKLSRLSYKIMKGRKRNHKARKRKY